MAFTKMMRALAVIAAATGASHAYAQQPAAAAPAPAATAAAPRQPSPEPKLVFDREVYSYASNARRDPFKALVGKESLGPLFEDLRLRGIIFSPDPTMSLVLLQDGSKRLYRMHRGEVIGNSRIVEVKPMLVRFAVENFGMIKYEVLELRPGGTYAAAPQAQTQVSAVEQPPANQPAPKPERVGFPKDNPARSVQLVDSVAKDALAKRALQQKQTQTKHSESETPR